MTRPKLGYSNYHWIRQDQKRLEKLRTKTERTTPEGVEYFPADAGAATPTISSESSSESGELRGKNEESEVKTEDSGLFPSGKPDILADSPEKSNLSPEISAAAPEIRVETPNKPQDSWALTTASQSSSQTFPSWSKNVPKD